MENTENIEILYDETSNSYHAFWTPPQAIGAGKTKLDALRDMQEAIHFSVDAMIEDNCKNLQNEPSAAAQDQVKLKARAIVSLLPKKNCGRCGWENCGQFALAVARGEASPYGCHRGTAEAGKQISAIAGSAALESDEPATAGAAIPEFSGRRGPWAKEGRGPWGRERDPHHPFRDDRRRRG